MRERDQPFKQVLNQAVREGLGVKRAGRRKPFEQITFDMGKPLVDLTKALSLASELVDAEIVAKMQHRRGRRGSR